jgi:hypothetical protein
MHMFEQVFIDELISGVCFLVCASQVLALIGENIFIKLPVLGIAAPGMVSYTCECNSFSLF